MWGLPFDLINEEAGSDIFRSIGELVEVDCKAFNTNQSRFQRVRVEVPLDKPLRKGGSVISPEGELTRVAFRYECLVGWCFNCGRIGHELKECQSSIDDEDGGHSYGEWLRAGTRGRQAETVGGRYQANQANRNQQ